MHAPSGTGGAGAGGGGTAGSGDDGGSTGGAAVGGAGGVGTGGVGTGGAGTGGSASGLAPNQLTLSGPWDRWCALGATGKLACWGGDSCKPWVVPNETFAQVVGDRRIPRPIGEDRGGVIGPVHHSPVKIWADRLRAA